MRDDLLIQLGTKDEEDKTSGDFFGQCWTFV